MRSDDRGGGPSSGRPAGPARRAYQLLISPRLALALLLVVLACCVVGVTVFPGPRAGELIFGTLWFNALLVLLAVSSAAAFAGRIGRRKLTLLSAGMILFHVCFVALLLGIVINRLFFFDGVMRLTEGETLPNGREESYDRIDKGRFFSLARLTGETTLVAVRTNFRVDGENKRAAYELAVSDGDVVVQRIIYVTSYLDFQGVRYFCQKEGYSVLLVMTDREGREIFGLHVPLQSYPQQDGTYVYATGTATEHGAIPFPPDEPRALVFLTYRPNTVQERAGDVAFQVMPLHAGGEAGSARVGTVAVGAPFDAGDFVITPREIRYWVGMNVRRDPGLGIVLASLSLGAVGMFMTLAARVRHGGGGRRSEYNAPPGRPGEDRGGVEGT